MKSVREQVYEAIKNYSSMVKILKEHAENGNPIPPYLNEQVYWINFIGTRSIFIQDEIGKVTLDMLQDGFNVSEIARHLGLSRTQIHRVINSLLEHYCG